MTSTTSGVNLVGYLRSENGLGQVARGIAAALDAVGIPHSDFVVDGPHRAQHDYEVRSGPVRDVNLVVVNADMFPSTMRALPVELGAAHTIAMWAWELDVAPASFFSAAENVDEVWSYSRFGVPALASAVDCPVHVGPVPVVIETAAPLNRAALSLCAGPLFLFSFDYWSVFERKNPLAVVDAFSRAFPVPGEASLVVKCVNGGRFPAEHQRLLAATQARPDIDVRDGYMSVAEQRALFVACDAYVSLHRAEGFGLTIAEAMLLGKPVVTTAYSGNLDFTTRENSYLVPWEPIAIGAASSPYPAGATWAEPDVAVAATHLRAIYDDPAAASIRANLGRRTIETNHSAAAAGACLEKRLHASRERRPRRSIAVAPTAPIEFGTSAPGDTPRQRVAFRVASRVRRFLGVDDSVSMLIERAARSETAFHAANQSTTEILNDLRSRVDATPYSSAPSRLSFDENDEKLAPGTFWANFADRYRGTEVFIRERMAYYVDALAARQPVVDLGCGRGELLQLLAEHSVDAVGVDSDPDAIRRLTQNGLRAVEADAVDYLASLADSSVGAVFSAQFVEHLRYARVATLFEAAYGVLKPGGLLVVETVNPLAIAALKTFWLDPTHEKPIYPETLLLMARAAGFSRGHIEFPFGSGDWDRDRVTAGEYSLIASTASS